MSRNRWMVVALTVVCAWAAAPAEAQDVEHLVRFGGGWYATTGDADDVADNGLGVWASYERSLSDKYGLELMAAYVDYDSIFDLLGGISLTPLTASLNVHLTPDKKTDFYVAPTIGYAWLDFDRDPFGFGFGSVDASDSGFAWGAALGVDYPFGQSDWFLAGSLRYLTVDLDGDFDNVVTHVGVGRRF